MIKFTRKTILQILLLMFLAFNNCAIGQVFNCGADFHGVGHIEKQCEQAIVITSTVNEGMEGSIVSGEIESAISIRIIPGYSKVQVVTDERRGSTKGTTGQKGDGRHAWSDITQTIIIYPNQAKKNISIAASTSTIIGYEIYSIHGLLLVDKKIKETSNYSINLERLKLGIHILKLYLKNGDRITEKIIKQ